jgi:sialate O-acetylesterase
MKRKAIHTFVLLVLLTLLSCPVKGTVRLPAIISDNMVLQQDSDVPIWGWAKPQEEITIATNWDEGFCQKRTSDENGQWLIRLKTPKAGGPFEIIIQGENTIKLENVMTGEVWFCSGQSNMYMPMKGLKPHQPVIDSEREIQNANFDKIRLFIVKAATSPTPVEDCSGQWQQCSPETVGSFSAAGYFFGKKLYEELGVPIGLIESAWGGTPAESWVSKAVLERDVELSEIVKTAEEQLDMWQIKVADADANGKALKMPRHLGEKQFRPSYLYNAMVAPVIPFRINGVIWYQGESNSARAYQYRKLFPALIRNWRQDWGCGDFPFYYVQLASFVKHQPGQDLDAKKGKPGENTWAELREAQLMTLQIPNVGMAVTIDIGEANNIHPANKRDVGYRLARWALVKDYGQDIVFSGPIYKCMKKEGNKIRLFFDYVSSGLVAKGEKLEGFAIAGEDRKLIWADAVIDGGTVVVWSDKVADPVTVRYGWAKYPFCNLFNADGLPASPFRTDSFPGVTEGKVYY